MYLCITKKLYSIFCCKLGEKKNRDIITLFSRIVSGKVCPYLWLVIIENLRSLEQFFFSVLHSLFFSGLQTIFLYAKKLEIQVLDWNTMCIWSCNMYDETKSVLSLGIHNLILYEISMGNNVNTINILCT